MTPLEAITCATKNAAKAMRKENLLGLIWKGRYRGQKQKWFIMRFIGEDKEINLKTKKPEFLEWKWISPEKITDNVVDFKLNVYKKIQEKIKDVAS